MIFVPVKKKFEKRPCKNFCLKKVLGSTKTLKWLGFGHVAVADYATIATWHAT